MPSFHDAYFLPLRGHAQWFVSTSVTTSRSARDSSVAELGSASARKAIMLSNLKERKGEREREGERQRDRQSERASEREEPPYPNTPTHTQRRQMHADIHTYIHIYMCRSTQIELPMCSAPWSYMLRRDSAALRYAWPCDSSQGSTISWKESMLGFSGLQTSSESRITLPLPWMTPQLRSWLLGLRALPNTDQVFA